MAPGRKDKERKLPGRLRKRLLAEPNEDLLHERSSKHEVFWLEPLVDQFDDTTEHEI